MRPPPSIVDQLSGQLSGSELSSLLLEVFNQRIKKIPPALLLKLYQANRLVHPAGTDMIELLTLECRTLEFLRDYSFQPIELSPAAQLGSCSIAGLL